MTTADLAHIRRIRLSARFAMVIGALFLLAGVGAWAAVSMQLASENITVADDAAFLAGAVVQDPLTALAQADAINQHALAMADGATYAELAQDDPTRESVKTASFLRASLFTSVVSFGVALFAIGVGVVTMLFGSIALQSARHPSHRSA